MTWQRGSSRIDELLADRLRPGNMRLHLVCPEAEIPPSFLTSVASGGDEGGLEPAAPRPEIPAPMV